MSRTRGLEPGFTVRVWNVLGEYGVLGRIHGGGTGLKDLEDIFFFFIE